jgi:hypothetical protein
LPKPAANSAKTMKNIEANIDIASGPIFSRLSASFAKRLYQLWEVEAVFGDFNLLCDLCPAQIHLIAKDQE